MDSLTEGRNRLSEIVEDVVATGSDYMITKHARPSAVIVGHDEYEALLETLNILSDPETLADLAEAETDVATGNLVDLA
ncbi:MAG: type II toxin-antitoxin system Phd/YefM family antitoxin [bacterium]|nr:type II toxin-antitoxin system Phd/YefM family antitoxin [bacterium]